MKTEINIPGSKSIAARALVCRLLSGHDTVLANLPDCGDTNGMLRLTEAVRKGLATGCPQRVDIGEGGTTLRFGMAACASLPELDITLVGSRRLMERPHSTLVDALNGAGADISFLKGENAVRIIGRQLAGGEVSLSGNISSQFVSALMLAAPVWKNDTRFLIAGPVVSEPYIRMTAGVMKAFGANVDCIPEAAGMVVAVKATGYAQCARYEVEGDWSGASYFYEARLIMEASGRQTPDFLMASLKAPSESLQGDSRVAAIFAEATRKMRDGDETPLSLVLTDAPDLVPAVAVGLCLAGVRFRISGVEHLHHKECDRMLAISTELKRLGYRLTTDTDSMEWDGSRCNAEIAPEIKTYLDHRMAMAFAPAALMVKGLTIENPAVMDKSFPNFAHEIGKMGVSING